MFEQPLMNKAHQLLTITRRLKGVQLDQFQSLIEGSQDLENDYNPTALRQIEEALGDLETQELLDPDDFHDIMALSQMMRKLLE